MAQELAIRKTHEKKNTTKKPNRNFQLGKTENIYSSQKNKHFMQNTGTTSVGLISTKKQSKIGEDLDFGNHNESFSRNKAHPSPQVKLNERRIPRKEPSKASKSSSKKSSKKRRVPKKYTRPNMTREKVSNKSLGNHDVGNKDLLSAPGTSDDKRKSIHSELKPKNDPHHKSSARFTMTNDKMIPKQPVIPEDQNEDYTDEDDSDSLDETVSSAEENKYDGFSITSSKDLAPPPMKMQKAASAAVPKKSIAETMMTPIISPPMNKVDPVVGNSAKRPPHLLAPLPDNILRKGSRSQNSCDEGENGSHPRITKSQKEFFTDISLLRNKSSAEKTKKVTSRLKGMI